MMRLMMLLMMMVVVVMLMDVNEVMTMVVMLG